MECHLPNTSYKSLALYPLLKKSRIFVSLSESRVFLEIVSLYSHFLVSSQILNFEMELQNNMFTISNIKFISNIKVIHSRKLFQVLIFLKNKNCSMVCESENARRDGMRQRQSIHQLRWNKQQTES